MRETRMLRAMWRALEKESRSFLNGHEGGNAGYSQGTSYGFTGQRSTRLASTESITLVFAFRPVRHTVGIFGPLGHVVQLGIKAFVN